MENMAPFWEYPGTVSAPELTILYTGKHTPEMAPAAEEILTEAILWFCDSSFVCSYDRRCLASGSCICWSSHVDQQQTKQWLREAHLLQMKTPRTRTSITIQAATRKHSWAIRFHKHYPMSRSQLTRFFALLNNVHECLGKDFIFMYTNFHLPFIWSAMQ